MIDYCESMGAACSNDDDDEDGDDDGGDSNDGNDDAMMMTMKETLQQYLCVWSGFPPDSSIPAKRHHD